MTPKCAELGRLAWLVGLLLVFFDHFKAGGSWNPSAFGPSWRFSARLDWASGCPQGAKNFRQSASHLLRRGRTRRAFPGLCQRRNYRACQSQEILHHRHDLGPALKLCGCPQAWVVPQQSLFLKAITMLNAVATGIERRHLSRRDRFRPKADEPTDTGTTSGGCRVQSRDAIDAQVHLTRLLAVQVIPALDAHALPVFLLSFPLGIGGPLTAFVLTGKALAVLAWRSALARRGRSRTVEDAIAFAAQQAIPGDLRQRSQDVHRRIVAVSQHQHALLWGPRYAQRDKTKQ